MALKLEIACFDLKSALVAAANGADRIELCSDYEVGGVTPPREVIKKARKQIKIPIHVIIRLRAGNFIYSKAEIERMKKDILFCKKTKVDGVVFGVLKKNNTVNTAVCVQLMKVAGKMKTTFHRAIDDCIDPEKEINKLVRLGFKNVLTSGGKTNALMGAERIKRLRLKFKNSISFIPGGGIRSNNLKKIILSTGCETYHSSANQGKVSELKKLKKIISSFE